MTPEQAATITAGAQVASTGINAMAQSNLNKKTQAWNEKIMGQQRQQSLADWTMQNEYNSPQAQMQRLKNAGLNPNLIYGKIDNQSASVRSTDVKAWNPQAPKFELNAGQVMSSYFDTKMKVAQTNNLEVQNTNLALEALYKSALIDKVQSETETNQFNLKFKSDIRDMSMQSLEQGLRKTGLDIQMGEEKLTSQRISNQTQIALQQPTIKSAILAVKQAELQQSKTMVETNKLREEIESIKQNQRLADFEEQLNKIGLTKSDPRWMRIVNEVVGDPKKATEKLTQFTKKYFGQGPTGIIYQGMKSFFNK